MPLDLKKICISWFLLHVVCVVVDIEGILTKNSAFWPSTLSFPLDQFRLKIRSKPTIRSALIRAPKSPFFKITVFWNTSPITSTSCPLGRDCSLIYWFYTALPALQAWSAGYFLSPPQPYCPTGWGQNKSLLWSAGTGQRPDNIMIYLIKWS